MIESTFSARLCCDPGKAGCRFLLPAMFRVACRLLLLATLLLPARAVADKVVLRIRAGNPTDAPLTAEIKSNLPEGIGTNDIISLGGLDLGYDVRNDVYFVHGKVDLAPKGEDESTALYDVEIRDAWVIPAGEADILRQHTASLAAKLDKTEYRDQAVELRQAIEQALVALLASQAEHAIESGASVVSHIRAYEAGQDRLNRVKRDVALLENLVLGTKQDVGQILGVDRTRGRPKREVELAEDEYRTVTIRITVSNSVPDEARTFRIRRELPPEVQTYDVLDPAGLDIGKDPRSGVCFVGKEGMELGPGEVLSFDVKVRDKWAVNMPRAAALRGIAEDVLRRISVREKYKAIEDLLKSILSDLDAIEGEKGPEVLNEAYVAFYRQQARRLDLLDEKLNRIEEAAKPIEQTSKMGFNVKPPSMKTTWVIIYTILGFLAVLSLLFFLRWFGKTKAERM